MARSIRIGMVVLVVGVACATAAYAGDPSKQTDAPMQKKMQKNEPSMHGSAKQKGGARDLGSTGGSPDDGMKSKPTRKGDKGQTDPLEQGGRSPSTSRDSSTGAGQ
jgi:hypothetical protein